ncbi:MAG: tetratricopeptide repeat protein [Pirellulales bacterium]|nr:tetratricopeptide repeat protein [Pirellulales bacterium]
MAQRKSSPVVEPQSARDESRRTPRNNVTAPASDATSPARRWLAGLLVVAVTVTVFGRSFSFAFLGQDDFDNILVNPQLNPPTWNRIARFWREPYLSLYIPVTYTFWSGETWLAWQNDRTGGRVEQPGAIPLDARVFRAGSILLHGLVVLAVYLLLLALVARPLAAAAGALLFALHPLQVESVGWITENKGLLATLFATLALWQMVLFWKRSPLKRSPTPDEHDGGARQRSAARKLVPYRESRRGRDAKAPIDRRRWLHFAVALVAFALALLAKPIVAALPVAAAAIAIGWLRRPWTTTVLELLPWCVFTTVVAALTMGEQGATTITHLPPLWQRPIMAGDALAFYTFKLVVPWPLGADYGRSAWHVMHNDWTYVTFLVPLIVLAVLWWLPQRCVWLTTAVVFVAGTLPVLGLMPFAYQNISTVADRYVYLAMLGPALALAAWLAARATWPRRAACGAVLTLYVILSFVQLGAWRDDRAWTDQTLAVNPDSFFGLESEAQFLQRQGRATEALATRARAQQRNPHAVEPCYRLAEAALARGDIAAAMAWYREALRIQPESHITHGYLAECFAIQGDEHNALSEFRLATADLKHDRNVAAQGTRVGTAFSGQNRITAAREVLLAALRLRPTSIEALNNLAVLEARVGNVSLGLDYLDRALAIDPKHTITLANRGVLLMASGRVPEAIDVLRQAVARAPKSTIARGALADVLMRAGRSADAVSEYRASLKLQPAWPEAMRGLAWVLATDPDDNVRQGSEALTLAQQVCAASQNRDPTALEALAAAHAELAQFEPAISAQLQALELWRASGRADRSEAAERRLQAYRARQPWREQRP